MTARQAWLFLVGSLLLQGGAPAAYANELGKVVQGGAPITKSAELMGRVGSLEHFRRWEREVGPQTNPDGKIRTVLYPLGNADVQGAMASFTGPRGERPERIVLVDAFPFGAPDELHRLHGDKALKRDFYDGMRSTHGYVWTLDFQQKMGITAPAILWELETLGARDVNVSYLDASGKRRAAPPSKSRAGYKNGPQGISYYDKHNRDFVEVTFSLEGKQRSILYVQHDLTSKKLPGVLERVLRDGVDGLLEKAAYLNMGAPVGTEAYAAFAAFRERARAALRPEHGVYLTDQPHDATQVTPVSGFRETKFGYWKTGAYRRTAPAVPAAAARPGRIAAPR